ncbi:FHA domain-containing protein [Thermodesulfobacteriota bacterium]
MKKRLSLMIPFVLLTLVMIQSGTCQTREETPSLDVQEQQFRDIILVLDNSGSMIKNDPDFLARNVVMEFLSGFKEECRVGMVIFDQEARLVEPLVKMRGLRTRNQLTKSLQMVNYKGLFSDTPAAIERAIYELNINGRKDAHKSIILLTDGIVDTGDKMRDLEREKWLKENLTRLSKKSNIRIFGIAFTDQADFRLIQTLAFETDGEYFRAHRAEDVEHIFEKINDLTCQPVPKPAEPVVEPKLAVNVPTEAETVQSAPPVEKKATPEPAAIKPIIPPVAVPVPIQVQKPDTTSQFILAGIIVVLLVIIMGILFARRARPSVAVDAIAGPVDLSARRPPDMPKAELIDVKNITGKKTFTLDKRISKIGRNSVNDIPIPMDTVSSFHATIEFRDGFFYLEDQRSTNMTFLNDVEVKPPVPVKLKSGDEITFNTFKFIFILPELIPAGETVMDFKGKPGASAVEETVVHAVDSASQDADELPQAMLIDVKNITKRKTFVVGKRITKIGRDINSDIAIMEDTISSLHATIEHREGFFYLEDQRSKNKTFLNGDEIESFTPKKLKSGDEIMINIYKFIFLLERQFPTGDTGERA